MEDKTVGMDAIINGSAKHIMVKKWLFSILKKDTNLILLFSWKRMEISTKSIPITNSICKIHKPNGTKLKIFLN